MIKDKTIGLYFVPTKFQLNSNLFYVLIVSDSNKINLIVEIFALFYGFLIRGRDLTRTRGLPVDLTQKRWINIVSYVIYGLHSRN